MTAAASLSSPLPSFLLRSKPLSLPRRKSYALNPLKIKFRLAIFQPPRLSSRPLTYVLASQTDVSDDDDGDENDGDGSSSELEREIFEFMQNSPRPDKFPSKGELIAAGRRDLVDSVLNRGGWLAFGWDTGDGNCGISQERVVFSCVSSGEVVDSGENFDVASSSGREMESSEDGGIEGILSRLERERKLSLGFGGKEKGKVVNGQDSWRMNSDRDLGHNDSLYRNWDVGGSHRNKEAASSESGYNMVESFGNVHLNNKEIHDVKNHIDHAPDMWRNWSLQRTGFCASDFEAAEIVPTYHTKTLGNNIINGDSTNDNMHMESANIEDLVNNVKVGIDKNQMRQRLQHLEADLTSALHVLKSRANGFSSQKVEDGLCNDLNKLSDAWEFQETEIIKAQHKVRSIRAKLAVLEGKLALETIEANKILEEKQIKLHAAESALSLLQTTCIIWSNSASEVLLAGSFDGWTSQRRMEKSSTGFFSLHLKLYPGRYEIKFIVDGVWRIDPLRPVVHNNGHENNLLIIN